jgi:hypothetical protein
MLRSLCAFISIVSLLLAAGCSGPVESSVNPAGNTSFAPLKGTQPVGIFSQFDWSEEALKDIGQNVKPSAQIPPHTVIASIVIHGAQVTTYRVMIKEAQRQARLLGANAIIIVEEQRPVIYSPFSGEPIAQARELYVTAVHID